LAACVVVLDHRTGAARPLEVGADEGGGRAADYTLDPVAGGVVGVARPGFGRGLDFQGAAPHVRDATLERGLPGDEFAEVPGAQDLEGHDDLCQSA
jgi:hypothetical protein